MAATLALHAAALPAAHAAGRDADAASCELQLGARAAQPKPVRIDRRLNQEVQQLAGEIITGLLFTTGGHALGVQFPVTAIHQEIHNLALSAGLSRARWKKMTWRERKRFALHALLSQFPIRGVDDSCYDFTADILHILNQGDL